MELVQRYLQHAKECRESAAKTTTPGVREHYLQMAEHWESLARQRAAQEHLEEMLAQIGDPASEKGDEGSA